MAKAADIPSPQGARELARSEGFVVVLVPETSFRALSDAAKKQGMSVSEAFGSAVLDWAERYTKKTGGK